MYISAYLPFVFKGGENVEEQMPCSPKDINVYHYALPSTLGRAEREEAAARILSFSQQLDRWVGVSWLRLGEMMQEDYKLHEHIEEVRNHNFDEQQRIKHMMRERRFLCFLTFGVYALFVAKPTAQMREIPHKEAPFSGIFVFGFRHVVIGIQELIANGMLHRVQEGEGDNILDVFFPTPKLVSRIMEVQGVMAS